MVDGLEDAGNQDSPLTHSTPPLELPIDHLWSGGPALPEETALVRVTPGSDYWELAVEAPFHGDPPPPGPSGATPGLWNFEVVEWFIAGPEERYLEVELGPHGHHLVLRLEGVRQVIEEALPLSYAVERRLGRWSGVAQIPVDWLPPKPWRVNAYAIHGTEGGRRYLAAHPAPGSAPDFHRLDSFAPVPSLADPPAD